MPTPGLVPAGYEFRGILGTGGSGWVSRAWHLPLAREVAIKTVLVGADGAQAVRRVEREAKVLAGLADPGVVRVHHLIRDPGALHLIMELLPGPTLAQELESGVAGGAKALTILGQLADTLTTVHRQGIVHRDIKPANIILHQERGAVLLDFGLARLPRLRSAFRTDAATPTGTPLYMAPEQLTAPAEAGPAVDAYAFGVLAYRMLVGVHPYPATSVTEILQAHISGQPTDPRRHLPAIPVVAAAALLAALHKDPEHRPAPAELVARLVGVPIDAWIPETRSAVRLCGDPGRRTGMMQGTGAAAPSTTSATRTQAGVESPAESPVITRPEDAVAATEQPPSRLTWTEPESWVGSTVFKPTRPRRRRWVIPAVVFAVGCALGAAMLWWWWP